jgi:hypothetical protein
MISGSTVTQNWPSVTLPNRPQDAPGWLESGRKALGEGDKRMSKVDYESGGDIMDPECIPICDALNSLEGVETISSCCGHGYAPFRIYFVVNKLAELKPILERIDESEEWRLRVSMATGNMEIYFILDGRQGDVAYTLANKLAEVLSVRGRTGQTRTGAGTAWKRFSEAVAEGSDEAGCSLQFCNATLEYAEGCL